MVHEVPDAAHLMAEVCAALRPGGRFLVVEPKGHVGEAAWIRTVQAADAAGMTVAEPRRVAFSRAALSRAARVLRAGRGGAALPASPPSPRSLGVCVCSVVVPHQAASPSGPTSFQPACQLQPFFICREMLSQAMPSRYGPSPGRRHPRG